MKPWWITCAYCKKRVRPTSMIQVSTGTNRERITCPCVYDFTDAELSAFQAQLDAWKTPF
jgi:hypothetical protein